MQKYLNICSYLINRKNLQLGNNHQYSYNSPILYQNWHGWFNKKSSDGPESVNQYFKMSSTTEQCSTLDYDIVKLLSITV
jgi:hypothetical protein